MKALAVFLVLVLGSSTVHANDREDAEATVETQRGSTIWKAAFASSTVIFLGLTTASIYTTAAWRSDLSDVRAEKASPGPITEDDCGDPSVVDKNGVFADVCRNHGRSRRFMLAAVMSIPFVAVTGYFAFVHVTKREKRTIALVPTVTTQSAGATLDIRW